MAISPKVFSTPQFRFGLSVQSDWGSENVTDAEIYEVYTTATPQITWNVIRDDVPRSDGTLIQNETDRYVSQVGASYEVQVNGILTDTVADLLLGSVMQDLDTESGTTPYLKTLEWNSGTTHIDYASITETTDPGILLTLNLDSPAGADGAESWYLIDAVCRSLTITSDPTSNGGRASFSATFFSGKAPTYGNDYDPSSWVAPGSDFYVHQSRAVASIGAVDVVPYSFNVTLENGIQASSYDGTSAEQYIHAGAKPFQVSGTMLVKYDDNTDDLIDSTYANPSEGGNEQDIIFGWGNGTADGTLRFNIPSFAEDGGQLDTADARGTGFPWNFRGMYDGATHSCQVLIANAIDREWTA